MVTAASLRADEVLRAVGVLRAAAGFESVLRALLPVVLAGLAARGLRAAAAGLVVRVVVALAATLRPVAAVPRDFTAAGARVADVVRAAPRVGAGFAAARVEARAVDLAAAGRLRAGAEAVLRAGVFCVVAARLVVLRGAAALVRVVAVFAVRGAEVLEAARAGALAGLLARVAVGLDASFLAAAERTAGLLAVRMVRDAVVRPAGAAVRRPPVFTAMARVRRPWVWLLSSVLMG